MWSGGDRTAFIDAVIITNSRATYQSFYYDAANRLTDSFDVGTNGGLAYTRPGSAPTNSTGTDKGTLMNAIRLARNLRGV